jgi:hypothetical protein
MTRKFAIGSCVCIILIILTVILFFTSKSENLVFTYSDISNNLYNIFPMRKQSSPYTTEYNTLNSLFSREFLNDVKNKITDRIRNNIKQYISDDLRKEGGSLFTKVSTKIVDLSNNYSTQYITSRVPQLISLDQDVKICSAYDQRYCMSRNSDWFISDVNFNTRTSHMFHFTKSEGYP